MLPFPVPRLPNAFHFGTFDVQRGKQPGFVEDIRLVPQRDVRQGPRAFQANHPGAQASQGKGDPVEIFTRVKAIEGTRSFFHVDCLTKHFRRPPRQRIR
jgi:hypothetical protein